MIKYAKIINENGLCEVGLGTNEEFYKFIGMVEMDVEQSDVDGEWYITEKCPHKSEEEKEREEKKRIAHLNMTKLDFVNALEGYNVTYEALKVLLDSNYEARKQFDLCERIYRFNPLLDQLAGQFGITPEQLDEIFKAKGVADV